MFWEKKFACSFQNPIENGQHTNSTAEDVKLMNERSHILYEQLKGFVQRTDMNVVKDDLPPKTVFVITIKLSSLQKKMYRKCLEEKGLKSDKVSAEKTVKRCFFSCYQTLSQVWLFLWGRPCSIVSCNLNFVANIILLTFTYSTHRY